MNRTSTLAVLETPKIKCTADAQQLGLGPVPVTRPKPTIALLAQALDAFRIRGMCRAVAYELLRYWKPGGTVFPSLATLAESLGLKPRMVRYHLAHLERVGLWVRHGRIGTTNTYELVLPGGRQPIAGGGGNPLPVEVTKEATTDVQRTRCQNCGYSWPASYGTDCYRCLKRQNGPKPRGGMPEYHNRPPRADPPPLTAAQTADLEARAISDGYHKRAGQWTKAW